MRKAGEVTYADANQDRRNEGFVCFLRHRRPFAPIDFYVVSTIDAHGRWYGWIGEGGATVATVSHLGRFAGKC